MIDSKAVAALLGVSRRSIEDWARAEKIPHYLIGGQYRFDAAEIEAWKQARHVEARV